MKLEGKLLAATAALSFAGALGIPLSVVIPALSVVVALEVRRKMLARPVEPEVVEEPSWEDTALSKSCQSEENSHVKIVVLKELPYSEGKARDDPN